jgi:hypothetical protein
MCGRKFTPGDATDPYQDRSNIFSGDVTGPFSRFPRRGLVPLYIGQKDEGDTLYRGIYLSCAEGRLLHVQGREGDLIHSITVENYMLLQPRKDVSDINVGLLRGVLLGHELFPGTPVVVAAPEPILILLVVEDFKP